MLHDTNYKSNSNCLFKETNQSYCIYSIQSEDLRFIDISKVILRTTKACLREPDMVANTCTHYCPITPLYVSL